MTRSTAGPEGSDDPMREAAAFVNEGPVMNRPR